MTPPVSETAAWTENDELLLKEQSSWKPGSRAGEQPLPRFAREIRRLRAENERLGKWYDEQIHLAFEVRRLRSELAAATRERETPPTTDLAEEYWCGCTRKASWIRCDAHEEFEHDEEPPVQNARPSRSRVSDNG